jgi:hypothetical protein
MKRFQAIVEIDEKWIDDGFDLEKRLPGMLENALPFATSDEFKILDVTELTPSATVTIIIRD